MANSFQAMLSAAEGAGAGVERGQAGAVQDTGTRGQEGEGPGGRAAQTPPCKAWPSPAQQQIPRSWTRDFSLNWQQPPVSLSAPAAERCSFPLREQLGAVLASNHSP